MKEYHKIFNPFKRDEVTKKIIDGEWTKPELGYLSDLEWLWTEKLDGTNIRVIFDGSGKVDFRGRTDRAQIPPMLLSHLQSIFVTGQEEDTTLYGEGIGYKIQKGGLYVHGEKRVELVLFDVLIGDWWLRRSAIEDISDNYKIPCVPIVATGTLHQAIDFVRSGFKSAWNDSLKAEGLVCFPKEQLFNRQSERIITKIKRRDFPGEADNG